jgi:CRP-like cAMP-binding protein
VYGRAVILRDSHQLREEAASAVARGWFAVARALYSELEELEPNAATWSKRLGETQRSLGDPQSAVIAFERAVDKYVRDGLLVQAIAVCKLILQIDREHPTAAERLAELATPTRAEARAVRTRPPELAMPTPVVEMARRAPRRGNPVTLPPGGGLDAIPLAMVMPDSLRLVRADGTDAGVSVLRIDVPFDEDEVEDEVEVIDSRRLALLRTPVFAGLAPATLEALIGRLELRELCNGKVFHEGDAGTAMFVISEGEVEVEAQGQALATLGPGAFFGEIALITDLPRSATVRAKGRVELLALDREVVRQAAVTSPEIVAALLHFVRARLVDRVSRTSPLFAPFSEHERTTLASRFETIEVDVGTRLIEFGERADGLYVVLAGTVEVSRDGEGAVATLSSGDVFGEMSLMGRRGSTAHVHATSRVLALRLPASVFQEIIVTYPQVLEFLGELTSSRSLLRQAEEFLDLHITLL